MYWEIAKTVAQMYWPGFLLFVIVLIIALQNEYLWMTGRAERPADEHERVESREFGRRAACELAKRE